MRLFYGDPDEFIDGLVHDYLVSPEAAAEFTARYLGAQERLGAVAASINEHSKGVMATPDRLVSSAGLLDVLHEGLAETGLPEVALWEVQDTFYWASQALFGDAEGEVPPEHRAILGPSREERFLERLTRIFDRAPKDDTHHLYHALVDDVADRARLIHYDVAEIEEFRRDEHRGYYPRWTDPRLVADTKRVALVRLESEYFHPLTLTRNVLAHGKQHDTAYCRRVAELWADSTQAQSPQEALALAERLLAKKKEGFFGNLGTRVLEQAGRAEDGFYVATALRDMVAAEQAFLKTYLER